MTNTYALTDYDVYDEEDNDDFIGMHLRRRFHKRRRKKRKQRKLARRRRSKPRLSRPPLKGRPKVVRGRPMKLPPVQVRGLPIVPRRKPIPKVSAIKIKRAPIVKSKTPISHLIKTTRPTVIKKLLSKTSKVEVKQLEATAQIKASKKAMESDGKTSKVVKVIAIVGVVGVTGFGIYKFIQNKKLNNGHISTSK
ncbi:hypothetical protein R5N98_12460 [Tenacibaculum maritimum]|uniref:hypothetical protein n=1 Tax=Tenacibaculum maritimum TaxID=107401 RepID=UPI0038901AB2